MSKTFDDSIPVVRHDFEQDIVLELAKQIAEDMFTICDETCKTDPAKIVEKLLSKDTVEPILENLKTDKGSRVKFKPPPPFSLLSFTQIRNNAKANSKILLVKNIPTTSIVKFLNNPENEPFRNELLRDACVTRCNVNHLAHHISELLLEPYRGYIVELFELKPKSAESAGGRKQKSRRGHKHRGHKQKTRRGHKQKSRRGHKTRRHMRRSTRKH